MSGVLSIVKRIKGGVTHYVADVAETGQVVQLTKDRKDAALLAEDACVRLADYYHGRLNAGSWHFESESGKPTHPSVEGRKPAAPVTLKPSLKEEFDRQKLIVQEQAQALAQAKKALDGRTLTKDLLAASEKEVERLKGELAAAEAMIAEMTPKAAEDETAGAPVS
jgi:hypothetical protein